MHYSFIFGVATLTKLYQPKEVPMQVVAFTSGSGTNVERLVEHERELDKTKGSPYKITFLVTDNERRENNAWKIAVQLGLLPTIYSNFLNFKKEFIKNPKDMKEREPYFRPILERIKAVQHIAGLVLAGYELIITNPLLTEYDGRIINIHPSKLSIRGEDGKPRFRGAHAVRDAILAGQKQIWSTAHLAISGVDEGPMLFISDPVDVVLPPGVTTADLNNPENSELANTITSKHQSQLKHTGDWKILPIALELLARGAFSRDERRAIYLRKDPVPNGVSFKEAQQAI